MMETHWISIQVLLSGKRLRFRNIDTDGPFIDGLCKVVCSLSVLIEFFGTHRTVHPLERELNCLESGATRRKELSEALGYSRLLLNRNLKLLLTVRFGVLRHLWYASGLGSQACQSKKVGLWNSGFGLGPPPSRLAASSFTWQS